MRRTIRAALCLLALCGGLGAQRIVKSSGGTSNVGDLGDVTLTSKTDGDGLRVNASGDFVNTALFDPTTTNLRADRMSANVSAALGGGLANAGCLLYELSGSVGCSSNFTFVGSTVTAFGQFRANVGSAATPAITFRSTSNAGFWASGVGEIGVTNGSVQIAKFGGTNTTLKKDTTTATGVTKDRCEDGAGQGVVACHQVESFAAFDGVPFSELSTHANGTYTYCTDCTKATPCASGGSGAFAKRINGAWDCD